MTIGLAFEWTEASGASGTVVRVFMNSTGVYVQLHGADVAPGARDEHVLFLSRRVSGVWVGVWGSRFMGFGSRWVPKA